MDIHPYISCHGSESGNTYLRSTIYAYGDYPAFYETSHCKAIPVHTEDEEMFPIAHGLVETGVKSEACEDGRAVLDKH